MTGRFTYQDDAALVGCKVELVFSPFDLEIAEVRYRDKSFGKALPNTISRRVHPKGKPETPKPAAPPAEHAERGRSPVLVVDEAYLLDNHQLEVIRLLTLSRAGDYPVGRARRGRVLL